MKSSFSSSSEVVAAKIWLVPEVGVSVVSDDGGKANDLTPETVQAAAITGNDSRRYILTYCCLLQLVWWEDTSNPSSSENEEDCRIENKKSDDDTDGQRPGERRESRAMTT